VAPDGRGLEGGGSEKVIERGKSFEKKKHSSGKNESLGNRGRHLAALPGGLRKGDKEGDVIRKTTTTGEHKRKNWDLKNKR